MDGTINRVHRFAGVSPEMTEGLCLPATGTPQRQFLKVTDRDTHTSGRNTIEKGEVGRLLGTKAGWSCISTLPSRPHVTAAGHKSAPLGRRHDRSSRAVAANLPK
jgi:hypothetical protein